MTEFDSGMRRQALSLPDLLRTQYEDLEPKARTALTTPEIFSIQRIVLTGCGDSHAAAMAVKYAFQELTGLPTEVVPAIELSRHYPLNQLGFAPRNPLVIAVSNSGGVVRTAEAMACAARHGAFTLAVTGREDSLLGRRATRVMKLNVPPFESAPGTRSYLVSLLSLLLLAIRFGEVRGRYTMDQAMDYRHDLLRQADELERLLPALDRQMMDLAGQWRDLEAYDFIGAGRDYGAAWFGHAKVFEAMGRYAMTVNTEEWLHLNFFMKPFDRIGTVLVCGGDSLSAGRARELLGHAVKDVRRPSLLITDDPQAFPGAACPVAVTPKTRYPLSGVLTQYVPLCLLFGAIGAMLGEEDGRGCRDNWSFAQDGAAIQHSEWLLRE